MKAAQRMNGRVEGWKDQSSNLPIFQSSAAFTLLEIMLAVTILAVIATGVYATWSAGLAGWKRSATVTESLQRERVVMEMLTELTQSVVFFASQDTLYDIHSERSADMGDSISFVTGSDLLLPAGEQVVGGLRRVTISLARDERGRPFLGISNTPALEVEDQPDAPLHVISADVSGFGVRYRDPRSGTWEDKWDEYNLIPSAIEYTIAFGANDGRTPPIIVTRAVELPTAQFALQALGESVNLQNTDNEVTRRDDIVLAESKETDTE